MTDAATPNTGLAIITPTRSNWADAANSNFKIIDAVMGTYFIVNSLRGPWANSTTYAVGDSVIDDITSVIWQNQVAHISSGTPTTFAAERAAYSAYWTAYTTTARYRGTWLPNTGYAVNDFVVSGAQYAVCISAHTSGASFAVDLAASKWAVMIDLSAVGIAVLPVPGGAPDANKFTVLNSAGTGYTIVDAANALTLLGGTSIGIDVFTAVSQAHARTAIGAEGILAYTPLNPANNLSDLSDLVAAGTRLRAELVRETLAELKALVHRPDAVMVKGRTTPNDGWAGTFVWVAGDTTTADDALIVSPTTGDPGRYKRAWDGSIAHVDWWAIGDGVTNDTVAIRAAASSGAGVVQFGAKTYAVKQVLFDTPNVTLQGIKGQTLIVSVDQDTSTSSSTNTMFYGQADGLTFDGFSFIGKPAITYGELVYPATAIYISRNPLDGKMARKRCFITNNYVLGGYNGIYIASAVDCRVENNTVEWNYNFGISVTGSAQRSFVHHNLVQFTGINEGFKRGDNTTSFTGSISVTDNIGYCCGALNVASPNDTFDNNLANSNGSIYANNQALGVVGGGISLKKGKDGTYVDRRYDEVVHGNRVVCWAPVRGIATQISSTIPTESNTHNRVSITDNDVVFDCFSVVRAISTIATTSGSQTVTVTSTAHGLSAFDRAWIRGYTLTTLTVGGVPLTDILIPVIVESVPTANTYTFVVDTTATSTTSINATGASAYCHRRGLVTLGANPIATTNGSADVILTWVAHGLVAGNTIEISGATAGAGIDATNLAGRFNVDSATTNTITFSATESATSSTSIGGAAVAVRGYINTSNSRGIVVQHYTDAIVSNNRVWNATTGISVNPTSAATAVAEEIRNPIITGNALQSCGYCIYLGVGNIYSPIITNNTGSFYINGMRATGNTSITDLLMRDNAFQMKLTVSASGVVIASATGVIENNYISAGFYGLQILVPAGGSPSSTLTVSDNKIAVIGINTRNALRVDDGTVTFVDNDLSGLSASVQSCAVSGTGAVTPYKNLRGLSAAIPVIAGSVWDFYGKSVPAAGAAGWACSVAGASGAATWVSL